MDSDLSKYVGQKATLETVIWKGIWEAYTQNSRETFLIAYEF
jgi:hypothetical protein